jgi:uncharacterized protein
MLLILALAACAIWGGNRLASLYTNWLWFVGLEFQTVFWRMVRAEVAAGFFFGLIAALLVGVNLWTARRFILQAPQDSPPTGEEGLPLATWLRSPLPYWVIWGVLVLLLSKIGANQWPLWLRYSHVQPFGVADPIFGHDVGFYVFVLPLYRFVVLFLLGGLCATGLAVGLVYLAGGGIGLRQRFEVQPWPLAHLSALGGFFLLLVAGIYRLKIYGLLYAEGKVAFGAGYVDVNVEIWAYWLLVLLFLGASVLFFVNVRSRGLSLPLLGLGLLVGGAVVIGAVPSALVQKLVVEPSELARETPYIEYNIAATRRAYGLDRIEVKPFEAAQDLSRADIDANPLTLRNVRIWDERPLVQTYQQIQEIRPYYVFPDVDVDRYTVDGTYRQVMLAAREMDTDRLPPQAQNWVNRRLQYTHGYGVALSPVNRVSPEGLPTFMIKDIPPVAAPGLEIDRPEIYYGERTLDYVVVKTTTQEFDYPKGGENEFSTYKGTGGVEMQGFFDRLAFAVRFKDINLVLSDYLVDDSRIMFRRQIRQRVEAIAPFLRYDSDPYLVLSEGKLYWIMDAYTTTRMYPYSTREGHNRLNYIRNSVKAVVDVYNGGVHFYRMDDEDPLAAAYAEIFPDLLRPADQMPASLKAHLRYPKDMFKYQATLYRSYHMQDARTFYNQEDLWEIPNEIYSGQAQRMEPYYIIIKLPGESREEFLLMVPFTPAKKDNMIGWLAARCDGENYGDLLVYTLPKDRLIFGPMQLEARIDQQPEISSRLTLWGQRGSEVIRGNLLAIPIERSFLYVEPIYLQARQESDSPAFPVRLPTQEWSPSRRGLSSAAIPELKQVIVAFGGQVIMRDTFEEALVDLFGLEGTDEADASKPSEAVVPEAGSGLAGSVDLQQAASMAAEAEAHYQQVRLSMQQWDWAAAGAGMEALEKTIGALRQTLEQEQEEEQE